MKSGTHDQRARRLKREDTSRFLSVTKRASLLLAVALFPFLAASAPRIVIEAEDGELTAPFIKTGDSITCTNRTAPSNDARAAWTFTISEQGAYALRAVVSGTGESNNIILVSIDKDDAEPGGEWQFAAGKEFQTNWVRCVRTNRGSAVMRRQTLFPLANGPHKLFIRCSTAGVRIDRFELFKTPDPPGGPRKLESSVKGLLEH